MKKWLRSLLVRQLYCWGVVFESDLPTEFVITRHAELRMEQRLRVKKEKMQKLVMKAWISTEKIEQSYINRKEYIGQKPEYIIYRRFMGYLWVFDSQKAWYKGYPYYRKHLITVYS